VVSSPVVRSQWSLVTNCAYNATSPFRRIPKSALGHAGSVLMIVNRQSKIGNERVLWSVVSRHVVGRLTFRGVIPHSEFEGTSNLEPCTLSAVISFSSALRPPLLLPSGLSHFAIRHSKFAMGHASVPHYARLVGARPSCYKMEALSHRTPDRRDTEANPCRFQGGAWSAVHPSCKREGVSLPGLSPWSTRQ